VYERERDGKRGKGGKMLGGGGRGRGIMNATIENKEEIIDINIFYDFMGTHRQCAA